MSEVRSSELEIGLSSNDDIVEAGGDTVISAPREVRTFHTFEEVCALDGDTLYRFKDRFQFPDRVRVRLPREEERARHFFPGEVCFYEATFLWFEVPRPSISYGDVRSLWNCSWVTYA